MFSDSTPFPSTSTPVSIAEEILQLAKSAFSQPSCTSITPTGPETDGLVFYNAKIQMQNLCNKLLQNVLGRQEYTVLLAGECCFVHSQRIELDAF